MNLIPVNEPLLDGNEQKYLAECITTGWISSEGPFVKRFESQFAAGVDRKYGIAVSNRPIRNIIYGQKRHSNCKMLFYSI